MVMPNAQQREAIRRCQKSVAWFLRNFGKIKHAAAGILPFHPFKYQLKAIETFRKDRMTIFKKCRQCFRGDQMVWGPDGPKRIDQITPGDQVYSLNPTTGSLEVATVTERFDNGLAADLVEVRTKTGHRSFATADHHYFSTSGIIPAANLTLNDRLIEVSDRERYGLEIRDEDAILLGYLLTDGSSGRWVTFNNSRWKYLLEYQRCFEQRFGKRLRIRPHQSSFKPESEKNFRLQTNFKPAKEWAKSYGILGRIKKDKRIPRQVFRWPNRSIALLLNRMFAGDGWYSGSHCNEVGIGLESIEMLHQIKQLLTRFGINATYYPRTGSTLPKLRIYGKADFNRFVEHIGIYGKTPRCPLTKGFFFNRKRGEVKSIEPIEGEHRVYDLRVLPYDNYVVDGAVVHNCGISKISGAFALWFAMFHPHKNILIVSRKNDDAMGFLREQVVFLFEHLPLWMQDMWKPVKQNEHEIVFPNGSAIRSLTSHPDVLRSQSASLNIIDEAAFIQGMDVMWAAGWPTLQHGGNVIVISTCVHPDTYIWTESGLSQIKDLAPREYTGYDDGYFHVDYYGPKVLGIDGLEMPSKFYKRPKEATRRLKMTGGHELEASTRHKLIVVDDDGEIRQRIFSDLKVGDVLPVKAGAMVFGNDDVIDYADPDGRFTKNLRHFSVDRITPDIGYLLGVITAEGHVRKEEVLIACGDDEVLDKCCAWKGLYWKRGRKDQDYVATCRKPMLVRFLRYLGVELTTAPYKTVPRRLLRCSEPVVRAFLQGLFDGDGCAAKRDGEVCLRSTSKQLIDQVRQLLFNYGILTNLDVRPPGTTKFRRKNGKVTVHKTKQSYRLAVSRNHTNLFYDLIGFGLKRKQIRRRAKRHTEWSVLMPPVTIKLLKELKNTTDLSITKMQARGLAPNVLFGRKTITKNRLLRFLNAVHYPGNPHYEALVKLASFDWFLTVDEITEAESEVYDFTMPKTHTFIGNTTVQMNTNGVGGWYWSTWTDAEAGANPFRPVTINWWDMDWVIEYVDPISREKRKISPLDGIRATRTKEEMNRYGKWWSPWLEEQFRALQEKGESWKFDQEVLAEFVGSGNTVLDKNVLLHCRTTVCDPEKRITGKQTYVHPVSGISEALDFDFGETDSGLWIWKEPVGPSMTEKRGNTIIRPGAPGHSYVMGVDIASGKSKDYHAIEILDVGEREQVAELMAHCLPRELVKIIDLLGRYYNCALCVVERNNGGDLLVDELRHNVMYPRLYRKKDINDKPRNPKSKIQRPLKVAPYGFFTTQSSKASLNKFLVDNIRDSRETGFTIFSRRLLKQINTYVRKRDRLGHDTGKTEAEEGAGNYDDLVMALALALVGTSDAIINTDTVNLLPVGGNSTFKSQTGPAIYSDEQLLAMHQEVMTKGGANLLLPMSLAPVELPEISAQRQLENFTMQLGAIPVSGGGIPIVTPPKFFYDRKK